MIARVWHGVVRPEKAEAYAKYLAHSEWGVPDYRRRQGNQGAYLLRRERSDGVHFLLISLWTSREAIEGYAGKEIERARYFPFDLACLIDPEPEVAHYEVLAAVP